MAAGFKGVSMVQVHGSHLPLEWLQGGHRGAVGPQVAASGATGESGVAASGGRKWSQVAEIATKEFK